MDRFDTVVLKLLRQIFSSLLFCNYYDKIKQKFFLYFYLFVNFFVLTHIHLWSSIIALGVFVLSIFINKFLEVKKVKEIFNIKFLILLVIVSGLSVLSLVLRPIFNQNKFGVLHEGHLELTNLSFAFGLPMLGFLVLLISTYIFFFLRNINNKNKYSPIKYMAIFGFATSFLFFIQLILNKLGLASEYSCKKFGFNLMTILFIYISFFSTYFITKIIDFEKAYNKIIFLNFLSYKIFYKLF